MSGRSVSSGNWPMPSRASSRPTRGAAVTTAIGTARARPPAISSATGSAVGLVQTSAPIDAQPMTVCGHSRAIASASDTACAWRTCGFQPTVRPSASPPRNTVWLHHWIGHSRMKKPVSIAALSRNLPPPPKARRASGRASTSRMLAIFGANHMISTTESSGQP